MDKFRLKFTLLESLLVVMLLSILWAFVIQIHRQEIHRDSSAVPGDRARGLPYLPKGTRT